MGCDRELPYSYDITRIDGNGFEEGEAISSYSVGSDVMAMVMSTHLSKTSLKIAWDTTGFWRDSERKVRLFSC